MKKIEPAYGADFPVTEKPHQSRWTEGFLHARCIMVDPSKEPESASVAAAQTSAKDATLTQHVLSTTEQYGKIFRACLSVPPMKLQGLTRPWKGADGNSAGFRIGIQNVPYQKIAPLKIAPKPAR